MLPPPAVLPAAATAAVFVAHAAAIADLAAVIDAAGAAVAVHVDAAAAAGFVLVSCLGLFFCAAGMHVQLPLPYRHHTRMFTAKSVVITWCSMLSVESTC